MEHFVAVSDEFFGVSVFFIKLGFFIIQDDLIVDNVFDDVVAVDLDLGSDPLDAVIGFGIGFSAVGFDQLAVLDVMGAGGAEVAGGSLVLPVSAKQLHFNGNRKTLVPVHALGRLAVDHDSTVAKSPAGSVRGLLAHKAVLQAQPVM